MVATTAMTVTDSNGANVHIIRQMVVLIKLLENICMVGFSREREKGWGELNIIYFCFSLIVFNCCK